MKIVLSAEPLIDSRWLTVSVEKVTDGEREEDYFLVSKGDVAMVAGLTQRGEVLLIKEYKQGCRDWVWQFPAGLVGFGETPLEAAHREFLEETGYVATSMEPCGFFYVSSPLMPDKVFLFIAKGLSKIRDSCLEVGENLLPLVIPLGEAVAMTMANEIKDSVTCFGIRLLWREF